jgi:hypothetical protein
MITLDSKTWQNNAKFWKLQKVGTIKIRNIKVFLVHCMKTYRGAEVQLH